MLTDAGRVAAVMLFQLTELEVAIVDYLADGTESLQTIARQVGLERRPVEPIAVITALLGLLEKDLVQCARVPGSSAFMTPTFEAMRASLGPLGLRPDQQYWFELTDRGQLVWETWQRAHP